MEKKKKSKKKTVIIIVSAVLIFVLLFSVASVIVCGKIYDGQFDRTESPDWSTKYGVNFETYADTYEREVVSVPSDDVTLTGYLYGLDNTKGLVVFCHGLGGGTELYIAEIIGLVDRGWQVLGVDFRGSFTSEGSGTKGWPQSVVDLDNILTWVESQSRFDGLDVVLFGHSWGGYAVTNVLNYGTHDIKAVVAVSAINNAFQFIGGQMVDMLGFFGRIEYPYGCLYQTLLYGKVAGFTAVDGINKSNIPVMIVQGDKDTTVVVGSDNCLMSYQDEITNPNVQYVWRTGEGSGTHNYILRSEDAYAYIQEVNAAYKQLKEDNGGNLTYEQKVAFYDTVDDSRISEIDSDFWDSVSEFYESAITK